MRRDVGISQTALDGGPQKRAAGLIDTAYDDCDAIQRCRDRRQLCDVDASPASAMTDSRCRFVSARPTAARDDDAARIIWSELGRYPPSDDAITADNQNVLISQAGAPRNIRQGRANLLHAEMMRNCSLENYRNSDRTL